MRNSLEDRLRIPGEADAVRRKTEPERESNADWSRDQWELERTVEDGRVGGGGDRSMALARQGD
jgi:hypothetical protein